MAIAVAATKEVLSTAYGANASWISVHTADPGTTGTSEVTGGSPAYVRKQTTWSPGAVDGVNPGNQVTIDVPASGGGGYTHIGLWTAQTAGTFADKYLLPTAQVFATQGQLLVTPSFAVT